MQLMNDDFTRLCGKGFSDKSTEEQFEAIKRVLSTEKYRPENQLLSTETAHYNPGVDEHVASGLELTPAGWCPVDHTDVLEYYPEYLPTDTAIERLTEFESVLEVGSGNGYWAYIINTHGGDVTATDLHPTPTETELYPVNSAFGTVWTDVVERDATTAIQSHPDTPVLLCHPDGATRWTEDVLDVITTQPLIFVGEWFPGADATPWFFHRLDTEWSLLDTFPVYDWCGDAQGYVFKKK